MKSKTKNSLISKTLTSRANPIHTTITPTAEDATYYLDTETYDLVILDWMLSDKPVIDLLSFIHRHSPTTPIIMLTTKSQLEKTISSHKAVIRRKTAHSPSPLLKLHNQINLNLQTYLLLPLLSSTPPILD